MKPSAPEQRVSVRVEMGRRVVRELAKQWRAIESTKRNQFITEDARLSTVEAGPLVDAVLDVLIETLPDLRKGLEKIKAGAFKG